MSEHRVFSHILTIGFYSTQNRTLLGTMPSDLIPQSVGGFVRNNTPKSLYVVIWVNTIFCHTNTIREWPQKMLHPSVLFLRGCFLNEGEKSMIISHDCIR